MMINRNAWRGAVLATLLGALAAGPAWAQDDTQNEAPPAVSSSSGPKLRPLIGGGFTFGGDNLATVFFTDGSTEDIKAGQLIQFYAGLEYQPVPTFSLQATVGYHVDDSGDGDASLRFSRYPVELLGHFHLDEHWRLGGGARFVGNAKLAPRGGLGGATLEYGDTTGVVVEGEYRFTPRLGLKVRYVSEEYELQAPFSGTFDGSHLGVMLNFYF
jgi:hypothetical protein